jgi:hypothetical protein
VETLLDLPFRFTPIAFTVAMITTEMARGDEPILDGGRA